MPAELPYLPFFRNHPEAIENKPPLISSLQALETMFFLIALKRLPAALMVCGQAIESGLKAGLGISADERANWKQLTTKAAPHLATHRALGIDGALLKEFRDVRNEFSHYGFSPDDNVRSAEQILEIGLPYLEAIYMCFFDFNLGRSLVEEHTEEYSIARLVYKEGKYHELKIAPAAFTVLAQSVRNRWQPTFTGYAEDRLLHQARENMETQDHIRDLKEEVEKELGDDIQCFECPVCQGLSTVVAEIDTVAITGGKLSLLQAICVECDLHIKRGIPLLADLTFAEQIAEVEAQVISEYGVAPAPGERNV